MLKVNEIQCQQACNKLNRDYYFRWDLNIYRGCQHGCVYCFAMYSHDYLQTEDYFNEIFVKTNIVDKLEEQLRKASWKKEVINIGGITDSYQPLEKKYKFMPDILKLMIKYKTPCNISTKSDLVLRDYNLIDELSSITYVNIAGSIICSDESVRKKLEPNGKTTLQRINMLKEFSKTNASTGIHLMPIVPYITDKSENLEYIYSNGADYKIDYILARIMNLRGRTRGNFFDFIRKEYPQLFSSLTKLYNDRDTMIEYKTQLYKILNGLRNKYGLTNDYQIALNEKIMKNNEYEQISLMDNEV